MSNKFRSIGLALSVIVLAGVSLPGCSDVYTNAIQYEVRTDPVFLELPGDEFPHPDSPGQLPVMNAADLKKEGNPYDQPIGDAKVYEKVKMIDPTEASEEDRAVFDEELFNLFGSPKYPVVNESFLAEGFALLELDEAMANQAVSELKLDAITLARGAKLYRIQCLQCHGVTGNGRGPSAQWVNPHPRDYRQGLFKFMSVNMSDGKTRKPLRSDLYRILYQGAEGTSMPAFNLLKEDELEALVSYVIHLSIRGEAEMESFKSMTKTDEGLVWGSEEFTIPQMIKRQAAFVAMNWLTSKDNVITPAAFPYENASKEDFEKSVRRGQAMFLGDGALLKANLKEGLKKEDYQRLYKFDATSDEVITEKLNAFAKSVNCSQCHKKYGLQAQWKFDSWGTMVQPRNLTISVYRGGRRPVDIYYRIHSGIKGSNMNAYGNNMDGEVIWDLVNFARALPYEARRFDTGEDLKYLSKFYPIGY